MTTATTAPAVFGEHENGFDAQRISMSSGTVTPEVEESEPVDRTQLIRRHPVGTPDRRFMVRMLSGSTDCSPRIYQYGDDRNVLIVVDFEEPEDEFPKDHIEVVLFLRANGRPILADQLVAMLQEAEENPEEVVFKFMSLRDMARLLVEQKDFADPSIGPDGWGVVHAQWQIAGDGLLVMSFLGYGEVLLTARANESPNQERLRISNRARAQDILREYGHLVPLRN